MIVQQKQFSRALEIVSKAISGSNIPILETVLLEAQEDDIVLTATDAEIGIRTVVPAQVSTPFKAAVPAKPLVNLIATFSGDVELDCNGKTLNVNSPSGIHRINILPAENFPAFPNFVESKLSLDLGFVNTISISALRPSVEQNSAFTGILLEIFDKQFNAVALDGFRMSRYTIPVTEKPCRILVPAKPFCELAKLFQGEILVAYDENKIQFRPKDLELEAFIVLLGNLKEYPDCKRLPVPTGNTRFIAKTAELLQTVKRIGFLADEKRILTLAVQPDALEISTISELGDGKAKISGKTYGANVTVKLNKDHLLDILNVTKEEEVELLLTSSNSAVFVRSNDCFYHVTMPFV